MLSGVLLYAHLQDNLELSTASVNFSPDPLYGIS